ncbi:ubiquitin carboxyl-terminal hydrolase MINDY-3-like, partial [Amphiura filiformis]|uniref:ubiquitin carboxyl-terminal hydrolase MINDY-3-like n=1 Tax=Amphiura filiformis TaxID=82378 RepID=UPI003B21B628
MASTSRNEEQGSSSSAGPSPIEAVKTVTWGTNLKEDVFARWGQGFIFSEDEPAALLQNEGGPCAIIAPLQGYILKNLLFQEPQVEHWQQIDAERRRELLLEAMTEVLSNVSTSNEFTLILQADKQQSVMTENPVIENIAQGGQEPPTDHNTFHSSLRLQSYNSVEEVHSALQASYHMFTNDGGVLLFLYSVLLTKGLDSIKVEVEDSSEPLIDGIYGHGSQSLINLMLTGRAVSHVFDDEKEVAGLRMKGVTEQGNIGFLTLLENLRYCEVGSYMKNPRCPIWVLGSETHLTVFFTQELSLVAPESKWETARRIFSSYDTEGSGFIQAVLLGDVLATLELFSLPEYVDIMRKKLDPDEFGIILLNAFMAEFFADEPDRLIPEHFTVYHYNGLKRSCPQNK